MRVAVDVMGGDFGPELVVPASLAVLDDPEYPDLRLLLVGPEARINLLLKPDFIHRDRVTVVDAPDEITMHDAAATAVRR